MSIVRVKSSALRDISIIHDEKEKEADFPRALNFISEWYKHPHTVYREFFFAWGSILCLVNITKRLGLEKLYRENATEFIFIHFYFSFQVQFVRSFFFANHIFPSGIRFWFIDARELAVILCDVGFLKKNILVFQRKRFIGNARNRTRLKFPSKLEQNEKEM